MSDEKDFGIKEQLKIQYDFNKILLGDFGYDIDNLDTEELNELLKQLFQLVRYHSITFVFSSYLSSLI